MMQVYQAFGIRISSDIKLPFIPLEQSEFVDLRIITVQDDLLSGIEHIAIPEVNDDEELAFVHDENVFIHRQDIVTFSIDRRGDVKVYPRSEKHWDQIQLVLSGNILGAYFILQSLFALHASTIELANGAQVAFIGPSGVGKSTLTACLVKKGASLVADDISVIEFSTTGIPFVRKGSTVIKLWQDVVDHFEMDISGLDRVQDDLNKFMVPFGQFSDGMDKSLLAVYLIKPSMSQKPEIRSLFGLDAFQAVSENIYQGRLVELLGKVQDHFQFSARLSDRIPVKVLERPSDRFCLDEMAQLVLDDVLESVG